MNAAGAGSWTGLAASLASLLNLRIDTLTEMTAPLRQLTPLSLVLRLGMALLFGGLIGIERGRKHRPAGFRTYIIVCMGAALTIILGQFEAVMLETQWAAAAQGVKTDVVRFGAQVINGIGFLGAGTILITGSQQIKGITTAASLWASACMGLALGAGFFECAVLAFLLIVGVNQLLPKLEAFFVEKARNMNICMELSQLDSIQSVIGRFKALGIQIYDVDIEREAKARGRSSNVVFSVRLAKQQSHTQVVAELAQLDCVRVIKEI